MKKTSFRVWMAAAMMLAVAGCAQPQPATEPPAATQQEPAEQAPAQAEPAADPQLEAETPASPKAEMNEQAAVQLAAEGMKRYWHVMSGGTAAADGTVPTVTIHGMEYRYLGSDLDTQEKLMAYLGEVFTPEASEAFIQQARIVEHEGRMAQPHADGGSLLQWENAQASLIKEEGNSRQYELKVPYGEEPNIAFEIRQLEVKQAADNAWKVASPPPFVK